MFSNFAWSEILVIVCIAIIVVGPKDLPGMLRQIGKTIGGVKRMAGDFQRQFNDAIKESELGELKDMTSTKGFDPLEDARKSMEDLQKSIKEPVKEEIEAPAVEAVSNKKPTAPKRSSTATKKPAAAKRTVSAKSTASKTTKTASSRSKPTSRKTAGKASPTKAPATKTKTTTTSASAEKKKTASKTTATKSKTS